MGKRIGGLVLISGGVILGLLFSDYLPKGTGLTTSLDSGWAALLGALLGSGITAILTLTQIHSESLRMADQRLFEARRGTYESAIKLMHFLFSKRLDGEVVPPGSKEAERYAGFDAAGRISLFASPDVVQEVLSLFALYDKDIPKDQLERNLDKNKIMVQRNKAIRLMRRDLGSGELNYPTKA